MGYQLNQEMHLFLLDLGSGECRQLTDGGFNVKGASWSPDGQRVVHTRTREGPDANRTDVWVCNADGSQARQLSRDQATASMPVWSPDGRWIAFTGNIDEGDAQLRPWLIDMAEDDGQRPPAVRPLGDEAIEVVGGELQWTPDGALLLLARHGAQELVRLSVPEGQVRTLVGGDRQLSAFVQVGDEVAFTVDHPATAGELFAARSDGSGERQLTQFNGWWSDRTPLAFERRSFEVPDGDGGTETVSGWLVRREGAQGPMPLLVDVHGGPESYALLAYSSHPHWPVLCAQGWAVLALNAVGSSSFGRRFSARLRGRWGEIALPQHLAAVEALRQEGVADGRVAISGKSYGCYLSAWAIGHTTEFRCAVVMAPVTNLETHYGTSDSGYYSDPYAMCGTPFIDRDTSQRLSPMKHAEKARTPTLIVHGKDDERCPKCQGEELYVTLKRSHDIPCEMALYPGGSHHFFEDGQPSHRLDAVTRIVEWLTLWVDMPVTEDESGKQPVAH